MKCAACEYEGDDFWALNVEAEPLPGCHLHGCTPAAKQMCVPWIEKGRGFPEFRAHNVRLKACPRCATVQADPMMPGVIG